MQTSYKQIMENGRIIDVRSIRVDHMEIIVTGAMIRTARIEEEWYQEVEDPPLLIETLKQADFMPDIFTFWQTLPQTDPVYDYYMEWDNVAAIPIKSFDFWWEKQINSKTRNMVRKARKAGVTVTPAHFDDTFIQGMTDIFNETPIRQGKPFWHYGKDFDTVKREFSRYLYREDLIGAYYNDELIGFIFLGYGTKYALTNQIISKIEHRNKAPINALIAKAVELCATKNVPYLVYTRYNSTQKGIDSLDDFKRHNGFQKIEIPRYYVPLTIKGKMALKFRLHHGLRGAIPERVRLHLRGLRRRFYKTKC